MSRARRKRPRCHRTGWVRYATRGEALLWISTLSMKYHDHGTKAAECPHCGSWHIVTAASTRKK